MGQGQAAQRQHQARWGVCQDTTGAVACYHSLLKLVGVRDLREGWCTCVLPCAQACAARGPERSAPCDCCSACRRCTAPHGAGAGTAWAVQRAQRLCSPGPDLWVCWPGGASLWCSALPCSMVCKPMPMWCKQLVLLFCKGYPLCFVSPVLLPCAGGFFPLLAPGSFTENGNQQQQSSQPAFMPAPSSAPIFGAPAHPQQQQQPWSMAATMAFGGAQAGPGPAGPGALPVFTFGGGGAPGGSAGANNTGSSEMEM